MPLAADAADHGRRPAPAGVLQLRLAAVARGVGAVPRGRPGPRAAAARRPGQGRAEGARVPRHQPQRHRAGNNGRNKNL